MMFRGCYEEGDNDIIGEDSDVKQVESGRQRGMMTDLQDSYGGANFDNLLTWLDTIVSLCRNLDGVCHKIDGFFPYDDGSNTMAWLKNAMEERANQISFSPDGFEYSNFCENTPTNTDWGLQEVHSTSPIMTKRELPCQNGTSTVPRRSRRPRRVSSLANVKLLENGGEMIVIKRRKKRSTNVNIIKVTDAYDYLLEIPWFSEPDPSKGSHQYKCSIPGVYWDKRSWIASWYRDGRRYYSSFSAKLHGFYKSKYYAIQVRLYNTMYNGRDKKPDYNVKDSYDSFCKEVL